jgi:hypothetical protein
MAPTQAICTSFKQELLTGGHNFTTGQHVFKIALVTSSSTISGSTANYSAIDSQVAGTGGYTTGGATLTNVTPTTSSTTALTDFAPDPTWAASTITARGALIYNTSSSPANKSVLVLDFGSDKSSSAGDFTVVFPAADASNAIIRIT